MTSTSTPITNTKDQTTTAGKNKEEDLTNTTQWIPVEANTEVFNSWAEQAGLIVKKDRFVDVYGIDDDFLSIVPQPTKAVILLFPDNTPIKDKHVSQDATIVMDGQYPIDDSLFFIKQETENQCGTVALINAIANASVTYAPDSPLQKFIDQCKDKTPEEKAKLLTTTTLFSSFKPLPSFYPPTRLSKIKIDQKPINDEEEKTKYHYSCFVAVPDPIILQDKRDKELEERKRNQNNASGSGSGNGNGGSDGDNGKQDGSGSGSGSGNNGQTKKPRINYIPPPAPPPSRVDQMVAAIKAKWDAESPINNTEFKLEGMRLVELDSRRPYPVDHGPCVDLLDDTVEFIKKYYFSLTETVYFTMLSFGVAPSPTSAFYPTRP